MKFAAYFTIALALFVCASARADIILTHGVTYTQNFNTLTPSPDGGTGTVLPNSPNGWTFVETGNSANTSYGIGTGSSNDGNTYSFGSTSSTDRAFGSMGQNSPTRDQTIGARFASNILNTKPFTKVKISYIGEQWKLGQAGRLDKLDFQISSNATSLTTGTWTNVDALDFIAPVTTGSVGTRNGNVAPNRTVFATMKIALPSAVSPGQAFWIRWNGFDAPSSGQTEDGLGIDDFAITAIPEPSSMLLLGGILAALAWYAWRRRIRSLCPAKQPR